MIICSSTLSLNESTSKDRNLVPASLRLSSIVLWATSDVTSRGMCQWRVFSIPSPFSLLMITLPNADPLSLDEKSNLNSSPLNSSLITAESRGLEQLTSTRFFRFWFLIVSIFLCQKQSTVGFQPARSKLHPVAAASAARRQYLQLTKDR